MNPKWYLDLAKALVAQVKASTCLPGTNGEAECRSAISRAYYAAFHVAQALFDTLGIEVPDSGTCHTLVQHGLNNSGDSALVETGSRLGTLYSERRRADYKMIDHRPEQAPQAEVMASLSEQIIDVLRGLQNECMGDTLKKNAIADAILRWATVAGKPLRQKR
jgi:uncharacterized protein (UPF0332 family)